MGGEFLHGEPSQGVVIGYAALGWKGDANHCIVLADSCKVASPAPASKKSPLIQDASGGGAADAANDEDEEEDSKKKKGAAAKAQAKKGKKDDDDDEDGGAAPKAKSKSQAKKDA